MSQKKPFPATSPLHHGDARPLGAPEARTVRRPVIWLTYSRLMSDELFGLDGGQWAAIGTMTLAVVAGVALIMNGRAGRHARRAAEAAERAAEASQQSARVAERALQIEVMPIVLPSRGFVKPEFHGEPLISNIRLRNTGRQTAFNGSVWLRVGDTSIGLKGTFSLTRRPDQRRCSIARSCCSLSSMCCSAA